MGYVRIQQAALLTKVRGILKCRTRSCARWTASSDISQPFRPYPRCQDRKSVRVSMFHLCLHRVEDRIPSILLPENTAQRRDRDAGHRTRLTRDGQRNKYAFHPTPLIDVSRAQRCYIVCIDKVRQMCSSNAEI